MKKKLGMSIKSKLVKKNEETGRTDTYTHEDTDNIKKWVSLQNMQ